MPNKDSKVVTNEDWLRTGMDRKALIDWLCSCCLCPPKEQYGCENYPNCKEHWKEWMKREHKETN